MRTVQQMKADPELVEVLNRAKGVLLFPHYSRGALGVGFQVGEGVLVTRKGRISAIRSSTTSAASA